MPYNLERLLPGDILSGDGHTTIFVGRTGVMPLDAFNPFRTRGQSHGGYAFVHVHPTSGLSRFASDLCEDWCDSFVYRCSETKLATLAGQFAKEWANSEVRTAYSPARTKGPRLIPGTVPDRRDHGVNEEHKRFEKEEKADPGSGTLPPMEFDAFLRALKWAQRREKAFSANRGSTCCAFVIACYHAAAIAICAEGNPGGLEAAYKAVKDRRLPKKMPAPAELVKTPSDRSLSPLGFRAFSNAGGTLPEGQTFRTYAQAVLRDLAGRPVTLEDVFTPEMLIDAKFVYTTMLAKHLGSSGGKWARMNWTTGSLDD